MTAGEPGPREPVPVNGTLLVVTTKDGHLVLQISSIEAARIYAEEHFRNLPYMIATVVTTKNSKKAPRG